MAPYPIINNNEVTFKNSSNTIQEQLMKCFMVHISGTSESFDSILLANYSYIYLVGYLFPEAIAVSALPHRKHTGSLLSGGGSGALERGIENQYLGPVG